MLCPDLYQGSSAVSSAYLRQHHHLKFFEFFAAEVLVFVSAQFVSSEFVRILRLFRS